MNDSTVMSRRETARDLDRVPHRLVRRQHPIADDGAERVALEELRHDERVPVMHAEVIHGDDVRVVQGRGGACFELEPTLPGGVARPFRRQHFDRDVAPKLRIARTIDVAHASGPDRGDDLEATDPIAHPDGHVRRIIAPAIPRDFHRIPMSSPRFRARRCLESEGLGGSYVEWDSNRRRRARRGVHHIV